MKVKTNYEIHALIGKCHLHTKKKCTYSITLKMGSKAIASTEYKLPLNDEINFNTELILKIDKTLFEGPGKLSIIVAMLSEEKQKKIIGSVFANFKQKGWQTYTVCACSCKDKGFQVSAEFGVVNIQNLNNNPNNNKIHSPNHQEMKDLKKALTVSREKQLIKSSRAKQGSAIKFPVEKTQSKLNKQKLQKQVKDEMSPDLSSLTTRIVPSSSRLNQQAKQYVNDLKEKIQQLQTKASQYVGKERSHKKQIAILQNQISLLKGQNQCLLELLTFQEEKSSAAMNYIQYLSIKIGQKQLMNGNFDRYMQLLQQIKKGEQNDAGKAIQEQKKSQKHSFSSNHHGDYSFEFKPISQKQQMSQQINQRLINQMEKYKSSIQQLRSKILQMETQEIQKNQDIKYLQIQIQKITKENQHLKKEIQKVQKVENTHALESKTLVLTNHALQQKLKSIQKSVVEANKKYEHTIKEKNETEEVFNKYFHENKVLAEKVAELEKKVVFLRGIQGKYQSLLKQKEKFVEKEKQRQLQKLKFSQKAKHVQTLKFNPPKTPLQSQIALHKSRQSDDSQSIQNIIDQINDYIDKHDKQKDDLLIVSRRVQQQNEHFLVRNKSQSLLKDLQVDPNTQDPNTNQTSKDIGTPQKQMYRATYCSSSQTKKMKNINVPDHQNEVQKYNYEYDLDSLNYFNNFEEDHQRISEVTGDENGGQISLDMSRP